MQNIWAKKHSNISQNHQIIEIIPKSPYLNVKDEFDSYIAQITGTNKINKQIYFKSYIIITLTKTSNKNNTNLPKYIEPILHWTNHNFKPENHYNSNKVTFIYNSINSIFSSNSSRDLKCNNLRMVCMGKIRIVNIQSIIGNKIIET